MSMPSSRIVPAVGSTSRSDAVRDRRLAAAGLADEAEHLARARARTRRRRRRARRRAAADEPPADAEVLDEIDDLEHGPRRARSRGASARDGSRRRDGSDARRAARAPASRDSSSARGQRSANAHAVGSSRSDGTRPGISWSRRRASSPSYGRGIAPSSPIVYGMLRVREQLVRPAPPRPCGRRTSRARGRRCPRRRRGCA